MSDEVYTEVKINLPPWNPAPQSIARTINGVQYVVNGIPENVSVVILRVRHE